MTKNAEFSPILDFSRGSEPEQLLWLVEDDGTILPGAFMGPMVFKTDAAGILWVGDTQNGRICAFSKDSKNTKTVDLIAIGTKLGLKDPPALLDMLFNTKGDLLVGDGANNVIIEISMTTSTCRFFAAPTDEDSKWAQINYIHSDSLGRIYVEDLALQRTVVLDENGSFLENLQGQVFLAINKKTDRWVTLVADNDSTDIWHVLAKDKREESWQAFAAILEKKPVLWVGLLGFDSDDNIYIAYETEDARSYLVYSKDAELVKSLKTQSINPGYDPLYPDWVSPDGTIYSVKIEKDTLRIMQLK
ncbi:MAG: hypothetical protein KKB51_10675 [Candidatus Riflebacteria bacterium]|nr:hypothetical protein [Candidatus Riflebacteria bacterium]